MDEVTVEQFGDVGVSADRGRRLLDVSWTGNTGYRSIIDLEL